MIFEYDKEGDILYIKLKDDKIEESEEIEEGIIVDYNEKGEIVGIEIIGIKNKKIDLNQLIMEPSKVLPIEI
jgi:uncharacterized protein YuzE